MRIFSQAYHLIIGAAAIASLVNCSGGGSPVITSNGQVQPQSNASRTLQGSANVPTSGMSVALSHPTLTDVVPKHRNDFTDVAQINAPGGNQTIVSDNPSKLVLVYGADGHLNALIHRDIQSNQGIATDAQETLYVADSSNVLVYAKPYTSLTSTLNDPNGQPVGVAVSPAGLVGVSNIQDTGGAYGSVSIFAKGATSPCVTDLQSPFLQNAFFDAFDAAGNLYFDGIDPVGRVFIGELSGGCNAKKIKTLTTSNTLGFPGGVQVVDGHLLIEDQRNKAIYTYALPKGSSLGAPTATTTLSSTGDPIGFAMRRDDHRAWVADATQFANATEYTYPGGSVLNNAYAEWVILGIAVNPAASP